MEQVITGWEGLHAPTDITFAIDGSLRLRWEHSFNLPLLAEAEQ